MKEPKLSQTWEVKESFGSNTSRNMNYLKHDPELWQDVLDSQSGKMQYNTAPSEPGFQHLWLQAVCYVPFQVLTVCVIVVCI